MALLEDDSMTKKEYLYELYQAKLITRDEVSESEKDSNNVYKVTIQGKTSTFTKHVRYNNEITTTKKVIKIVMFGIFGYEHQKFEKMLYTLSFNQLCK